MAAGRLGESRLRRRLESDLHEVAHIEKIPRLFILADELAADEANDRQELRVGRGAGSSRDGAARSGCLEVLAKKRRLDADMFGGVHNRRESGRKFPARGLPVETGQGAEVSLEALLVRCFSIQEIARGDSQSA